MLTPLILIYIIKTTFNINYINDDIFNYYFNSNVKKEITKTSEYLLLDSAYKNNSVEGKNAFFCGWLKESDSIRNINHANDTLREIAYELFTDIFLPDSTSFNDYVKHTKKSIQKNGSINEKKYFDYKRITYPFYRDAKYIVLQNSVHIHIYSDKDLDKLMKNSLDPYVVKIKDFIVTDFAPPVSFYNKKILICSDKYKEILDTFLLVNLLDDKYKFLQNTDSILYLRRSLFILS